MNTWVLSPSPRRLGHRAFTMTELALSIAVVSVALVAIIGVLPTGLNVQRQNREETIVNEDGKVLLNAIRTGTIHNDNLTNYVDFILYERYHADSFGKKRGSPEFAKAFRSSFWNETQKLAPLGFNPSNVLLLTNSAQIVSLLTAEREILLDNKRYVNVVRAQFRAISGPLTEKPLEPLPNGNQRGPDGLTRADRTDFSFRYLVTPEVTVVPVSPGGAAPGQSITTAQQIRELSLVIQWPVTLRPKQNQPGDDPLRLGNNRRVYRAQVYGQLLPAKDKASENLDIRGLRRFAPNSL